MFVGFCLVVVRVEAADAVVVVTAGFSEFFGEGEAEVAPVVVAGGDVKASGFDALGYDFDVVVRFLDSLRSLGMTVGGEIPGRAEDDGCVAVCWLV